MSRYLLHGLESASFSGTTVTSVHNPDEVPSLWEPYLSMFVRSLRRQTKGFESRWQRRIFQILESDFHLSKAQPSNGHRAWQVCFQILTSHNYWKRRKSPTSAVDQTWQHTLWRAAHLQKRLTADLLVPPAWGICLRVILADSLRSRNHGWHKRFTTIAYVLRYKKSKTRLYLRLLC